MTRSPNRLPADIDHRLKGREIDRSQPLSFRLDGHEIHGFGGDTLLSAALASGLVEAGTCGGEALALDERFAPAVLLKGDMHDRLNALPMALTPAVGGLDLVTLAKAGRNGYRRHVDGLAGLLPRARRSLGLRFDDGGLLASPWFDAVPEREIEADLAVIGGGYAGLSAALVAGRRGERVVLVERRQWLGGNAHFFGSTGDEPSPDETIARLTAALKSLGNVTILLRAEAFAAFEGSVRINQVVLEAGIPASRALTLQAPRIILANGNLERLPVFAGNRLPGVVGALAAFHRADRFGVWIGRRALLSTATSVGYRAVMQAKEAGIDVVRVADTRLNPQSRFVEFGKASGIPLARDLKPVHAAPAGRKTGLHVVLAHILEGGARATEQFSVDQLLVSGGWQPDLSLWHMAGGGSRWQPQGQRLEAEGALPGIALAGSVAGYRNGPACLASGEAAVALLYGRSAPMIRDVQIDPMYETPDDAAPVADIDAAAPGNAYLDGGVSLALRPSQRRAGRRFWSLARRASWGVAEQARALGVADVAAGVQLGEIPSAEAAIVAQERCITPGDIVDAGKPQLVRFHEATVPRAPPAYLAGRFGTRTSTWVVEASDGRTFEVGCLVHLNADDTDPRSAVGAVFAPAPEGRTGGLAVIGKAPVAEGEELVVKDISTGISVRLVDPLKPIERPVLVQPVQLAESAGPGTPTPSPSAAAQLPATAGAALALIAGMGEAARPPAAAEGPAPPANGAAEAAESSDQTRAPALAADATAPAPPRPNGRNGRSAEGPPAAQSEPSEHGVEPQAAAGSPVLQPTETSA
ncbi:MAG: FAD-dependent oxidoreductase [Devosia sp.]|nr:FAD-dependent oxidoreductase [Devosia sp.]